MRLAAAVGAALVASVACRTPTAGGAQPTATRHIRTVFVIVMENENWSDIVGNPSAPYINDTLLPMAAHADDYYDNPDAAHPSLPNYLWMEAGSDLGIGDDRDPPAHPLTTSEHLVTQLDSAGYDWRSYQEDMPSGCPIHSSGLYAAKHNPMVYFTDVVGDPPSTSAPDCLQHVRPYTELFGDLAADRVAAYDFITPNLCDDMHDAAGCGSGDPISHGDAWLSHAVPAILASKAYKQGGALFITWDESMQGEHPIGMIVLSPFAKKGYSNAIRYYHSSLLRTVEQIFGLPYLRDAANQKSLSDLFAVYP